MIPEKETICHPAKSVQTLQRRSTEQFGSYEFPISFPTKKGKKKCESYHLKHQSIFNKGIGLEGSLENLTTGKRRINIIRLDPPSRISQTRRRLEQHDIMLS